MKNIICLDLNSYYKKYLSEMISDEVKDVNFVGVKSADKLFAKINESNFDAIIVDCFSFKEEAMASISKLREKVKDKKIIVTASYYNDVLSKYCKKAGASVCLDKNDDKDIEKLISMIKNINN